MITDATLIYDAEGSDLVSYEGVDLTLDWPDPAGAARIKAALRPAGQKISLDAAIGGFSDFLNGKVQIVEVALETAGGNAKLDGRASLEGAVAGNLALNSSNTSTFLAALGVPGVALPDGLGRRLTLQTELTLTPDRLLALRQMVADLGGNVLRGAADIMLDGVPQVNAQLTAGALNFAGLTGGEGGATSAPSSSSGAGRDWPRDSIDASGLAAFNGAISLKADSIDLGVLKLGATRSLLANDRSRMVFELRDVAAYGGNFAGEFVMNNRNGLSVGGKLRAKSVQLNPLLNDLADLSRFKRAGRR